MNDARSEGTPTARPILTIPDRRLRLPTRAVRVPDRRIERLVGELFAAMRAANGVGLAANQIGEDVAVAVIDTRDERAILINPVVESTADEQMGWEGCLSVPHVVAEVRRADRVSVRTQSLDGRWRRVHGRGLFARALLHETDHLLGRIYVDLVPAEALIDTRVHPTPPDRAASPN
jgi:peptide deformylase